MRRLRALVLFTLGYTAIALLEPAVAAGPALIAFYVGGLGLAGGPEAADDAELIALELVTRR